MKKQLRLLKRFYAKELTIPEKDISEFMIIKHNSPSQMVIYLETIDGIGNYYTYDKRDLSFISKLKNAVVTKDELKDANGDYSKLVVNKLNLLFGMSVCVSDIQCAFLEGSILNACVSGNSMRFQGDFQIKIIE